MKNSKMKYLKTEGQSRSTRILEYAVSSLENELRCVCGKLMAKLTAKGIELKCRGCKRIFAIPYSQIEGWSRFGLSL